LDLKEIYDNDYYNNNFVNKRYNPGRFIGLIFKVKSTGATATLFATGSIVIAGGKSVLNVHDTIVDIIHDLASIGRYDAILCDFKVTNICASIRMKKIDLIKLAESYPTDVSYETSLFPGAKYYSDGIIFTVHHTGSVFATGFKNEEQMNTAFENIQKKLLLFLKN
jgi:TATA-box binding protein (TBP) (component of TFIID and TFIIIB)